MPILTKVLSQITLSEYDILEIFLYCLLNTDVWNNAKNNGVNKSKNYFLL